MPKNISLHMALIAVLGLLIYSNTLHVPFQWDELYVIKDNPIIKDLDYFAHPSTAKGFGPGYYSFRDRYMGYLTFALNYRLHGLDVTGYHVVNVALHILNSLLVYALVRLTLRTPALNPSPSPPAPLPMGEGGRRPGEGIALFVALIFVSHPVQTEAVTYIMGRLPLLMWFFYLSSMVLYIKWRLGTPPHPPLAKGGQRGGIAFYLLSLLSAVLAMKTKENAFTLPLSIALYEFLFFGGNRKRFLYLIPFMLTLLIIPLSLMSFGQSIGETMGGFESASRHYTDISRMSYLFTQFRVLVTYLRLLFLPVTQNFDYDYPVYDSFFAPPVFLSFLFLLSVFGLGAYLLYRSHKGGTPALRLLAWGIFWFFLTLSVESSVFPIPMLISEYRLYAPSIGISLAVLTGGGLLLSAVKNRKVRTALLISPILVALVLSAAAYSRNTVWASNISLWADVARKSPGKPEIHNNLAVIYAAEGMTEKAVVHLISAIRLNPEYVDAHTNLANAYFILGETGKAKGHYLAALALKPDHEAALFNLGILYLSEGRRDEAVVKFRAALKANPKNKEAARLIQENTDGTGQ